MSIVRQLVDELHGKIDVRSQVDVGTEVCVSLDLESEAAPMEEFESSDISEARRILHGKRVCLVGFQVNNTPPGPMELRGPDDALRGLRSFLQNTLTSLLDVTVVPVPDRLGDLDVSTVDVAIVRAGADLERFLYTLDDHNHIPILELGRGRLGRPASPGSPTRIRDKIVSCSRPYGPRKIACTLVSALRRAECSLPTPPPSVPSTNETCRSNTRSPPSGYTTPVRSNSSTPSTQPSSRRQSASATSASAIGRPLRPTTQRTGSFPPGDAHELPSILLVEDNMINMKLLATFFARSGYSYTEASNGLEAVKLVHDTCQGFDVIMMDLQVSSR